MNDFLVQPIVKNPERGHEVRFIVKNQGIRSVIYGIRSIHNCHPKKGHLAPAGADSLGHFKISLNSLNVYILL